MKYKEQLQQEIAQAQLQLPAEDTNAEAGSQSNDSNKSGVATNDDDV